jgi:hypothetical protein
VTNTPNRNWWQKQNKTKQSNTLRSDQLSKSELMTETKQNKTKQYVEKWPTLQIGTDDSSWSLIQSTRFRRLIPLFTLSVRRANLMCFHWFSPWWDRPLTFLPGGVHLEIAQFLIDKAGIPPLPPTHTESTHFTPPLPWWPPIHRRPSSSRRRGGVWASINELDGVSEHPFLQLWRLQTLLLVFVFFAAHLSLLQIVLNHKHSPQWSTRSRLVILMSSSAWSRQDSVQTLPNWEGMWDDLESAILKWTFAGVTAFPRRSWSSHARGAQSGSLRGVGGQQSWKCESAWLSDPQLTLRRTRTRILGCSRRLNIFCWAKEGVYWNVRL